MVYKATHGSVTRARFSAGHASAFKDRQWAAAVAASTRSLIAADSGRSPNRDAVSDTGGFGEIAEVCAETSAQTFTEQG